MFVGLKLSYQFYPLANLDKMSQYMKNTTKKAAENAALVYTVRPRFTISVRVFDRFLNLTF